MNTKLITALRVAANALDDGTFAYNWNYTSRCNCGVLVCALTGVSSIGLIERLPKFSKEWKGERDWSTMVGLYCPISGKTTHELFAELEGYGLSAKTITQFEYLKDPAVLARAGRKLDFHSAKDAALYMRTWADLLVEQGKDDTAPTTEAPSHEQANTHS